MNTEAEGRIADETCAKQLLRKLRNHTEAHRHYYGKKECPICEMNKVVDNYLSRPEPQAVSGETPETDAMWRGKNIDLTQGVVPLSFARSLERRLQDAHKHITHLAGSLREAEAIIKDAYTTKKVLLKHTAP